MRIFKFLSFSHFKRGKRFALKSETLHIFQLTFWLNLLLSGTQRNCRNKEAMLQNLIKYAWHIMRSTNEIKRAIFERNINFQNFEVHEGLGDHGYRSQHGMWLS